ncbi:MAG: ATP-binding protein, partial [Spirochaetota bacterium]
MVNCKLLLGESVTNTNKSSNKSVTLKDKNILKNEKQKLKLNFFILESERAEGKYIDIDMKEAGFKPYDNKAFPWNNEIDKHMFTLRSIFYLDKSLQGTSLALFVDPQNYPHNIYLNGEMIHRAGRYKENYNSAVRRAEAIYLSDADLIYSVDKPNEIAVELFPMYENTPLSLMYISSYDNVITKVFWTNFFYKDIIRGSFFISLIISLYFVFLIVSGKFREKKYFYFALACLFFALAWLNTNFNFDTNNELLLEKISRVSLSITTIFSFLFMLEFTRILNENKKLKHNIKTITYILIISLIVIIFIKDGKQKVVSLSWIYDTFVVLPFLIFDIIVLVIAVIKYKEASYYVLMTTIFFILLAAVRDILASRSGAGFGNIWYAPFAYIIFVISIFLILAREQSKIFEEKEKAQQEAIKHHKKSIEYLHKVDKLKDEFLVQTSHELKTPLNGIIGITDYLIDGATGKLPADTVRQLSIISNSSRRLSYLINDILDYSLLKNSEIKLNKKAIDLKHLTDIVLIICGHMIEYKSLNLINNIEDDIPYVYADEDRLEQILYNLVGNAIKYTESGNIKIYTSQIPEKPGMLVVSVTDTGKGIQTDMKEEVFNKFTRLEEDLDRSSDGGLGLGLSITKNLVELHGGEIWLESFVGEGSTFNFTLPISDKETSENTKDKLTLDNTDNHRILTIDDFVYNDENKDDKSSYAESYKVIIADDELANIQVVINHLNLAKFQVIPVTNGVKALEMLEKEKPDLMILDLMMPHMSGFDVCRRVREKYSSYELPILILTAKTSTPDILAALKLGANDYITKPFDKEELLARVNTHLKLKSSVEEIKKLNRELEEKVMLRTSELEEANKELKAFSYRVSHDLRNPINVIIGYKGVIMRNFSGTLDSKVKSLLDKIEKNAYKLTELIDSLLELSDVKRRVIEPTEINLSKIVLEITERLQMDNPERNVVFNIQSNLIVKGDLKLIKILMDNLIGNAWKYSAKEDMTMISFGTVDINGKK